MNIKKILVGTAAGALMLGAMIVPAFASTETVYNALPIVSPATNYSSQPFQAQQVSEFGDLIHLGGTNRSLNSVTVTMSDYALYATYLSDGHYSGNAVNWTHPITLNVYNVISETPNAVGSLLGSVTQTITIPWRPVGDASCPILYGERQWIDTSGNCNSGYAFNATFDMSSLNVTLPNDVIVTVAFNTQSYGVAPIGVNGPYNLLNVMVPNNQSVSVGTDDVNSVFLSSTWAGAFVNGSLAGRGLKEDTGWAPNGTVALQVTASAPDVVLTDMNQCKNGGWQTFSNPTFKNQGTCVSYVQANEHAGKK